MPYADQATVDHAKQILANGTAAQRKTLLTTNPILPPSGGIRFKAVNPLAAEFKDVVKLDYSKLKIGAASDSIAFIKLRPNEKNEIGAITFSVKTPAELPTVRSRTDWTAVWWLPWQSEHIVKIKIRSNVTDPVINCGHGVDPVNNPPIFFTAAINGCSVFAAGDARNPSMYHGGVDGAMTVRGDNELTEAAWLRLLGRVNSLKNIQSIGKTDYISEMKPQTKWTNPLQAHDKTDRTSFETQGSRDFTAELEGRGSLTNVTVQPWGMVFGLRDANDNWEMTLVKNAFVRYQKIQRKKRFLRRDKITHLGETRTGRTYNSDGDETLGAAVQCPDIHNCHTLGYQDFFPGVGAAQMHDLTQIVVY
jgi:hypothetical protein